MLLFVSLYYISTSFALITYLNVQIIIILLHIYVLYFLHHYSWIRKFIHDFIISDLTMRSSASWSIRNKLGMYREGMKERLKGNLMDRLSSVITRFATLGFLSLVFDIFTIDLYIYNIYNHHFMKFSIYGVLIGV